METKGNGEQELHPVAISDAEIKVIDTANKAMRSPFDTRTLVNMVAKQIALPANAPAVRIQPNDVLEFIRLAASMNLDPSMGGLYGFKTKDNKLVMGVGLKGWRQALSTQPTFRGLCYPPDKRGELLTKRIEVRGQGVKTITCYSFVTCVITKGFPDGTTGTFEGTAYFDEEFDPMKTPWVKNPKRMLENRALTIAASNAYGWGAYGEDEAAAAQSRPLFTSQAVSDERVLAHVKRAPEPKLIEENVDF